MSPEDKDTYRTLLKPTAEVLFKDRNSKFYGYAYPLDSAEQSTEILMEIRQKRRKASHLCFAWQWGIDEPYFRVSDDGEPTNSAGMPIYGQIQSFGLTNVLVAVTRFYGGTKLGVGGLIQAYRASSKMALESGDIVFKTLSRRYALIFGYAELGPVMRAIKQYEMTLISREWVENCRLVVEVPLMDARTAEAVFVSIPGVTVLPV